jgi:hypothetical protein
MFKIIVKTVCLNFFLLKTLTMALGEYLVLYQSISHEFIGNRVIIQIIVTNNLLAFFLTSIKNSIDNRIN